MSTVGDVTNAHQDVTGVLMTADTAGLMPLPDRLRTVNATEARIVVATAAASSSVVVALYRYVDKVFSRVPGTRVSFDTTATGLKSATLKVPVKLSSAMRLFVGYLALGGAPSLEGYQSGASAAPKIVRRRSIASQTDLKASYSLAQTTLGTSNADFPLIAYLSAEAADVV